MNIQAMREHAENNVDIVLYPEVDPTTDWLALNEESLQAHEILPPMGSVFRVVPPNDGNELLVETREEGVFLYTHNTVIQINGSTVTVH